MFSIFGYNLTLMEFYLLVSVLLGGAVAFYKILSKLNSIEKKANEIDSEVGIQKSASTNALQNLKNEILVEIDKNRVPLETRINHLDERVRAGDVYMGRVDEKLGFIQAQIVRLLNIVEKKGG